MKLVLQKWNILHVIGMWNITIWAGHNSSHLWSSTNSYQVTRTGFWLLSWHIRIQQTINWNRKCDSSESYIILNLPRYNSISCRLKCSSFNFLEDVYSSIVFFFFFSLSMKKLWHTCTCKWINCVCVCIECKVVCVVHEYIQIFRSFSSPLINRQMCLD